MAVLPLPLHARMTAVRGDARRGAFVDRQRELQLLAGLLEGARNGRSGVLVIRGEAGIGKTALLDETLDKASDIRAIHVRGAESEMELAYAGVQQLCTPLLGLVDRLPEPQHRAIRVALGLSESAPPNALLVGLAVLTLLGEAGAERPTACIIEDTQWVDKASLQTVAFVARRILADPVVLLFAIRDPWADRSLAGLPELNLRGLDDADARALLSSTMPGHLNRQVRENIIAEAGGNPLALTELHLALRPSALAGGYGLINAKPIAGRIEETFSERVRQLPYDTRVLLLIAAAEPTGNPAWLWAAAERLGIGVDAASAAETSGLVAVESRIRFRHPLVRSAVYHGALLSDRHQVHAALAEAVDGPAAGEHRAWHRAHATAIPDEEVAAELEQSADLARSRGGVSAAAAFLVCAADLTPDPNRRAQRAIEAAQAKLEAGAPQEAWELSVRAEDATDDALLRARVELLRAKLAFAASRGNDAPPLLLAAAKRLENLDPVLARETYLEALMAAIIAGRLSVGQRDATRTVAAAARHAPPAARPPTSVDLLLEGLLVRILDGYVSAAPLLRTAIRQFCVEDAAGTADPRWHDITNRVSLDLFDQDTYDSLAARQLDKLRADDALTLLPVALTTLAGVYVQKGHFSEARALLEQAEAIRDSIGAPPQRYIEPILAANRGQEQLTRELVRASIDCANERGEGFAISVALYASAILDNSLGQYREALSSCQWALQHDDLGLSGYLLIEMVEAATHCGEDQVATDGLCQLDERAQASGTNTALGLAARSTALVSEGPAAEAEYLSAIAYLERAPVALYRARTHLVYGEWLRRIHRRKDARRELRLAYDMFEPMGARIFAERTRHELETTGEFVSKPEQNAIVALTAQERHITRLAREGYTNPEIGAQLFLSPRTVEWHLGKIFGKLGVTSRRSLRNVPVEPV